MRRLAIMSISDAQHPADDATLYLLQNIKDIADDLMLVAAGVLSANLETALMDVVDEIVLVDPGVAAPLAWKAALAKRGGPALACYDEIILLDDTFFGPLFPFAEMFHKMAERPCDFWSILGNKEIRPNHFDGSSVLPAHLKSNFLVIRKKMFTSTSFEYFWRKLSGKTASGWRFDVHFTKYFQDSCFKADTYLQLDDYGSYSPGFIEVDETLLKRCPIIEKSLFLESPDFLEKHAVDLPRALRIIEEKSDYDTGMIYKNIIYSAELRTLNTNATLLSVLPDTPSKPVRPENDYGKLAVCAHIYYVDMMDEILRYTDNIPVSYDFIATTDTLEKKAEIERITGKHPKIKNTKVLIVEKNRGRDMSSLFITCRDILLSGDYSLVCRVHTKKTPQVFAGRGNFFKRHMFDNLLNSAGYVTNVLNMFHDNPFIGVALPPLIHISYGTLGHSWFVNRKRADEIASEMDLKVCLDSTTPVSAYGTMFWFRPEALKKLFAFNWKWDDFNPEPHHVDGSLAHVLERLIPYVAQDAGFTTQHIMSLHQVAQNYVWLEYKLERLASALPTADFGQQFGLLRGLTGNWRGVRTNSPPPPGRAFREFGRAVGRSVLKRIGLQAKKRKKLR